MLLRLYIPLGSGGGEDVVSGLADLIVKKFMYIVKINFECLELS